MATATPTPKAAASKKPAKRWVDPLRVHDDIRFGVAQFRAVTVDAAATEYAISITRNPTTFTGPTLYAAAETARLHHQQLHDSTFPPIYTRRGGVYTWWDGEHTDSDTQLRQWVRLYIAKLFNVSVSAVRVVGPAA